METTTPPDRPGPEESEDKNFGPVGPDEDVPGTPRPVNWNLLLAHAVEQEWRALNRWVEWVRREYALPASVIRRRGAASGAQVGALRVAPALARRVRPGTGRLGRDRVEPRLRRRTTEAARLGRRLRTRRGRDRPDRQTA